MTGAFGGELLYGLISGLGATLGLGLLWRVCQRLFAHPPDEQKSLRAILLQAVRIPIYLCIMAFGLRVALAEGPDFSTQKSWLVAADLFLSFFACIGAGEILFGLGVDYYLRVRREAEIPTIFNQLIKAIIYLIVGLSFLSTTYKIDITPLLTTSAIFSMVIGLALQDVLSNFFAGLSVHISPPFRLGDWVKIGGFFGRVIESNWRATTLRTTSGEAVTLPNNDISKKDIVNCSSRQGCIMQEFTIGLGYETSPETARRCLYSAAEQVTKILNDPQPRVFMEAFADFSITYRIRYWIGEEGETLGAKDQLASRIWYRLKREGVGIPYPIREVYTHPEKDGQALAVEHRMELLSQIDFLRDLDRTVRAYIAQNLAEHWFEKNEVIVQRGTTGSEFYLIDKGRVDVFIDFPGAAPVASLGSGQFFGEMSLLTGEPRSATVVAGEETRVLVLTKEVLGTVMRQHDELARVLSDALAQRQVANRAAQTAIGNESGVDAQSERSAQEMARSRSQFMSRIRKFFGMG